MRGNAPRLRSRGGTSSAACGFAHLPQLRAAEERGRRRLSAKAPQEGRRFPTTSSVPLPLSTVAIIPTACSGKTLMNYGLLAVEIENGARPVSLTPRFAA
jgi:hypothetical protein